ncbi:hypothetical protein KW785_00485 [Candidatus Parcubacteria bacterium]|nr:hypothetical protein [Candidatus Parcubacteria bacterium]
MIGYVYLAGAFVLNSLGTVLVKIHSARGFVLEGGLLSIITKNISFIGALLLFALNLICYSLALSRLPLSVGYPVMTVASFVIVNAFSYFYFREHIGLIEVLGYALILVGITLVISFGRA